MKKIELYVNKAQFRRLATNSDDSFEAEPYIDLTVPNNCKLHIGYVIDVKLPSMKLHAQFEVATIISSIPASRPDFHTIRARVTRNFLNT